MRSKDGKLRQLSLHLLREHAEYARDLSYFALRREALHHLAHWSLADPPDHPYEKMAEGDRQRLEKAVTSASCEQQALWRRSGPSSSLETPVPCTTSSSSYPSRE